jgi:ketosteroid isomerase-like protein
MKIRLVVALAGLAISFALPTFAQQTNTPDPELCQQIDALNKKTDDAYKNNDPAAVAALFTGDAVLVTDIGPFYGREAIEKYYADLFKQVHFSNHLAKPDQYSPHVSGGFRLMWLAHG